MRSDNKYNFDEMTDRRKTGSLKWDVAENELPMWVADMDFRTAPEITEALRKTADGGIFGYSIVPPEWSSAYKTWWSRRHGFEFDEDALIFSTGVIPILSSVIRKLTTPAEKIVVQTPVYNIFFNSILNNGRVVYENKLVYDGTEYNIDFADLEEKLSDPQTSMMILCNPHNPTGQIRDRETLGEIGRLCAKYNVIVVSDEIHCDITRPGCGYVPFASVSDECRENSVTCIAPTKAFNLAGIQTAAALVPNPYLRHKVWRGLNTDEVAEPNIFAVTAAVTAFTKGEKWLDEMRGYVFENRSIAEEYIRENIPGIKAVPADATYLLWLDCTEISDNSDTLAEHIRRASGLYISSGSEYRSTPGFLRMNIACPRERLYDGLERLKTALLPSPTFHAR